jgi:hypothetical protein
MSLRPAIARYPARGSLRETEPAVEPVTADELRALLVETTEGLPDMQADALILISREQLEQVTGLALISQGWRLALDAGPGRADPWWDGVRQGAISELRGLPGELHLPVYPLQTVDAVTVFGLDGSGQAVDVAATFTVDTFQQPGRMVLKFGQTWPIALAEANAVQIEYTAGFGDGPESVPAALKRAILQMAAYLHEHRGDGCTPGDAWQASGAAAMAGRYAVKRL